MFFLVNRMASLCMNCIIILLIVTIYLVIAINVFDDFFNRIIKIGE